MILDIGTGGQPDTFYSVEKGNLVLHTDVDPRAYHLETLCTVYNLPFKDHSFKGVHASHLLEHLDNPSQAVEEMKRVLSGVLIVKVPNGEHFNKKGRESADHVFSWTASSFYHFLKRHFKYVQVSEGSRDLFADHVRQRKLRLLKMLLLSSLLGRDEIIAYASDRPLKLPATPSSASTFLQSPLLRSLCFFSFLMLSLYGLQLVFQDLYFYNEGSNVGSYLMMFIHMRLYYLLPLILWFALPMKHKVWSALWSYKTWLLPSLSAIALSIGMWQFKDNANYLQMPVYHTELLGFSWSWSALLEYSALFITLLWLYQQKTTHFAGFTLGFLSLVLSGILYEVPDLILEGSFGYFDVWIEYILYALIFVVLLWQVGFHPVWQLSLTLVPVVLEWFFLLFLPHAQWLPRLAVFPFFLALPLMIKKETTG